MARFAKTFKKYEKTFLTVLVVVLLATFSVSGIISQCGEQPNRGPRDFGGTFQVAPGQTVSVDNDTYVETFLRYRPLHHSEAGRYGIVAPSLLWAEDVFPAGGDQLMSAEQAVWAHIAGSKAALEAGYRVGEQELADGVRYAVGNWRQLAALRQRPGRLRTAFSPDGYEELLRAVFQSGTKGDFEKTVREIVLRDKFLTPLVTGMRWSVSRAEAYERWKASMERVDLDWVAVPAKGFEDQVKPAEETRTTIARDADILSKVVDAAQTVRTIVTVANETRKSTGNLPKDEADLKKTPSYAGGLPTDAWKHAFGYKVEGDQPKAWSAGPDGEVGTADDVTIEVSDTLRTLAELKKTGDAVRTWRDAADGWPEPLSLLWTANPPSPKGAKALGLVVEEKADGMVVTSVADRGPARRAGVVADDRLVSWDGKAVKDKASLDAALSTAKPGDKADLVVSRKGENLTLKVTLDKALPPLLATAAKDAWDRELSFDAATGTLLSMGPDGQKGNADDVTARVTEAEVEIGVPARFGPYVHADAKDAWGRPLKVRFSTPLPPRFEVSSDGPDGKPGTEDDLREGNTRDLLVYFERREVKQEMRIPDKMSFEALWVALPLIPDESLKAAWEKFDKYRPPEEEAWNRFDLYKSRDRASRDYYQIAEKDPATGEEKWIDPADREKGHGAALVLDLVKAGVLPPGTVGTLVPSPDAFGAQKDPPAPKDGAAPETDPVKKAWIEKGWRRILLRELFVERMLADFLKRAGDSQKAHKAWEDGGKQGAEPAVETFDTLLAPLRDMQPGEADRARGARFLELKTVKDPLSRAEWEKIPELWDVTFGQWLRNLKDGEYASIPATIKESCGRVAVRCLKFVPARDPELDEVRDKIWPGYLAARAMERAAKELERVRKEAEKPDATLEGAAKTVAAERGFPWFSGTTGLFSGHSAPVTRPLPEGADEERKAQIRRRAFVRMRGYSAVRSPDDPKGDPVSTKVGTLGRSVLKDEAPASSDGTGSAYLVRVREQRDPAREEFTTVAFRGWLREKAYDFSDYEPRPRSAVPLKDRKGLVDRELARWFGDWDTVRALFDIRPTEPLESSKDARP